MTLREYQAKRDFTRTNEPEGAQADDDGVSGLRFVVHKHAATRLHYDLRLELDGVLKSWAVPKGPSLDPSQKRLAVEVEDHPLEYAAFEGVIPEGEYGAGTVMVWDQGVWEPVEDPHAGFVKGSLKFVLHGQRLVGRFALVRMKRRPGESRDSWLLIKERDQFAASVPDSELLAPDAASVRSGRTMQQIAADAR
ncbi:MAG: hypothetical protein N3B11_07740 [Coriobacteriia bacterium]|nr:hypothetical protein [Coriobacteriia bacterium]